MAVKNINEAKRGITSALLAGATWGIDTVLVGLIMAATPFIDNTTAIALAPFVSTFMHDFFSGIWATLFMLIKGQLGNVLKSAKSKGGLFIILGALLGGPVGMTCYLMSIKYIGAAYSASITAIFPAVGAILAAIFLKEKMNGRVWAGIALSIFGVITLGYVPSQLEAGSNFIVGIMFALGTVFAWGIEGVICAYGMKYGEVDSEHAMNIRQVTSALFYGIIIIPFIKGYGFVGEVFKAKATYQVFGAVDFSLSVPLLIGITALFGTISYIQYYRAISIIGAARSTALNITYGVWAIIFQAILFRTSISLQLIIGAIIVLIGSMLVSGNPKELIDFSDDESDLAS
jgi:drug/metabolite transporter (DMT)-like permease